jgi:hypothetical protein
VLGSGSIAGGAASLGSFALVLASTATVVGESPEIAGGSAGSLRAGGVTSGALAPPERPAIGAALAAFVSSNAGSRLDDPAPAGASPDSSSGGVPSGLVSNEHALAKHSASATALLEQTASMIGLRKTQWLLYAD